MIRLGLDELDAAAIRLRAPRALTQAISRLVYGCRADDGDPQFAGVAYGSRLGDEITNWAVFERTNDGPPAIEPAEDEPLAEDDADLLAALALLDVRLI